MLHRYKEIVSVSDPEGDVYQGRLFSIKKNTKNIGSGEYNTCNVRF